MPKFCSECKEPLENMRFDATIHKKCRARRDMRIWREKQAKIRTEETR